MRRIAFLAMVFPLVAQTAAAGQAARSPRRPTWKERIAPYREVVLATAKANRAKPAKERRRDDALADAYLRAAATRLRSRVADVENKRQRREEVRAFCVAMGVLLDRTGALPRNRFARLALGAVETDAERKERQKLLGDPTVRKRTDWCRHFWVSVGLRALVGRAMAENVGVAKEFADAKRLTESREGEGFSMGDLCANLAGVELAERLLAGPPKTEALIGRLARGGRHADFMPEAAKLPTNLDAAAAAKRYGHTGDPRMRRAMANLRMRVRATPGHKPPATPPPPPKNKAD